MKKIISAIAVVLMISGLVCSSALAGGPKKINKCMTITKSGSYVVNKNLKATEKTEGDCIIIDADFVTLDLNGFTLTGLDDGTGVGVWDNKRSHTGIVVRNGAITKFLIGINLNHSQATTVERILITKSHSYGMWVGGACIVTGNKVLYNSTGMIINCPAVIIGNTFKYNSVQNLNLITDSSECTVVNNAP